MRRFLPLLLILAFLAACPAPPVSEPFAREQGCNYPLTAQMYSGYTAPTSATLADLAAHDLVVLNLDAPPVAREALQRAGVTVLAYIPAGYWWSQPLGSRAHRNAVLALLDEEDYLHDAAGGRVEPWPGQPLLNHADPRVAAKVLEYLTVEVLGDGWNGVHWDVMDATLGYVGGNVDLDRNGINDRSEHDLAWIDSQWRKGLTMYATVPGLTQGNAAWGLADGGVSPWAGVLSGALVEDGPATKYRDAATGRWLPAGPEAMSWHIGQALRWRGEVYAFGDDMLADAYFGRYVHSLVQARRVALAMATLTDSYLQMINPASAEWCDECGVENGATARSAAAGDWLGCPLGPLTARGQVLTREFAGGWVALNTGATRAYVEPPAGMQTIRGWYDRQVNDGAVWSGVLGPYDARFLVRSGAAPAPTATRTLAERLGAVETRVAELGR